MNKSDIKLPDLAFIDVETTGLFPPAARVIEIAITRLPPNPANWDEEKAPKLCLRFTPSRELIAASDPKAFSVNGYYEGHPDWVGAPEIGSEVAKAHWAKAAKFLKGAALVAQNLPFDRGFMENELRQYGLTYFNSYGEQFPWARRFLDIQSYSYLLAEDKGLGVWGLHDVYAALQFPALQEHRAEADVKRGIAVMKYVWSRYYRETP